MKGVDMKMSPSVLNNYIKSKLKVFSIAAPVKIGRIDPPRMGSNNLIRTPKGQLRSKFEHFERLE